MTCNRHSLFSHSFKVDERRNTMSYKLKMMWSCQHSPLFHMDETMMRSMSYNSVKDGRFVHPHHHRYISGRGPFFQLNFLMFFGDQWYAINLHHLNFEWIFSHVNIQIVNKFLMLTFLCLLSLNFSLMVITIIKRAVFVFLWYGTISFCQSTILDEMTILVKVFLPFH